MSFLHDLEEATAERALPGILARLELRFGVKHPASGMLGIEEYTRRIVKYFAVSPSVNVAALIYLERIPGHLIPKIDPYRLLITCWTVAAKFHEDHHFGNSYYAKIGGLRLPELNALEIQLLDMVGYRLPISSATYEKYCSELAGGNRDSTGGRDPHTQKGGGSTLKQ